MDEGYYSLTVSFGIDVTPLFLPEQTWTLLKSSDTTPEYPANSFTNLASNTVRGEFLAGLLHAIIRKKFSLIDMLLTVLVWSVQRIDFHSSKVQIRWAAVHFLRLLIVSEDAEGLK
ncbi:hypothetical protein GcC1_177031 [Golovinomyces cichoracearum]|uniref:Uncharacterized protein n=1 Tax=Golovinomyces cichoracearum TaxID=62708 RepID=A0A420HNZ9_9PEZI|nr:hypothetical protein GcC1_177031 [Golovinomyces cichoracearum]